MKTATMLLAALIALALLAGGCMPHEPLADGQMDAAWRLSGDRWADTVPIELSLGGRRVPTRLVFRREPSLIWSTVSMVRAADKLKAGAASVEIGVSKEYAEMLVDLLADARGSIERLREIADPHSARTAAQWAATVAEALAGVEKVVRATTAEPGRPEGNAEGSPLGWTAGPMLEMVVGYLNRNSAGSLFSGAAETTQLRDVLAQLVLRLSFAMAGREEPAERRPLVVERMSRAADPKRLHGELADLLARALPQAAPAPPSGQLPALVRRALAWTPRALAVLEQFIGQWDRMDSLSIELRELAGDTLAAITLRAAPGKQVVLDGLFFMQPQFVLRGGVRVVVQPSDPATGEAVVNFEPVEGGAAEVRFRGAGYSLVRALALPLADAAVREVRVAAASRRRGPSMVNVVMLMEATGSAGRDGDRRRLIAFSDVRVREVARSAFAVAERTTGGDLTFNYLTPRYRYTYRRAKKSPADE